MASIYGTKVTELCKGACIIYMENLLPSSLSGIELPSENHGEATVGVSVRSGNPRTNPESDEPDTSIATGGVNLHVLEHFPEKGEWPAIFETTHIHSLEGVGGVLRNPHDRVCNYRSHIGIKLRFISSNSREGVHPDPDIEISIKTADDVVLSGSETPASDDGRPGNKHFCNNIKVGSGDR